MRFRYGVESARNQPTIQLEPSPHSLQVPIRSSSTILNLTASLQRKPLAVELVLRIAEVNCLYICSEIAYGQALPKPAPNTFVRVNQLDIDGYAAQLVRRHVG